MPDIKRWLQKAYWPEITKVVDFTDEVTLQILRRDNKKGAARDRQNCPVAHACRRCLPIDDAIVAVSVVYLKKGKTVIRCALPEALSREVVAVDREAKVPTTGTFVLKAIPESRRLGHQHVGKAHSKKVKYRKGPRPAFRMKTPNIRKLFG